MLKIKTKLTLRENKNGAIHLALKKLIKPTKVKVGIITNEYHTKKGSKRSVRMQDLATWMNRGIPHNNTPPRPYNIMALVKVKEELLKVIINSNVYNVKTRISGEGIEKVVSAYKRVMLDFENPPNAPATIRKKGFNDPLYETGELIRAVEGQVDNEKKIGKGRLG